MKGIDQICVITIKGKRVDSKTIPLLPLKIQLNFDFLEFSHEESFQNNRIKSFRTNWNVFSSQYALLIYPFPSAALITECSE
jgi:hypothetical protein